MLSLPTAIFHKVGTPQELVNLHVMKDRRLEAFATTLDSSPKTIFKTPSSSRAGNLFFALHLTESTISNV
jgi:hypothetical protein